MRACGAPESRNGLADAGYEFSLSSDSYAAIVCFAALRQLNAFARSRPARRQRSASPIISAASWPNPSASPSSTSIPASAMTSGMLEVRKAGPLVAAREHEAPCSGIQVGELLIAHAPEQCRARHARWSLAARVARDHQLQLRADHPGGGQRTNQSRGILARIQRSDKQQVTRLHAPMLLDPLGRARPGPEHVVGGFRHDPNATRVDARKPGSVCGRRLGNCNRHVSALQKALAEPVAKSFASHPRAAPGPWDEVVDGDRDGAR